MAANYYTLREGDEVYGSDGEKLGKVVAADANYVVIEKGWFFPTDYYIPTSAITSYDDGRATLNVTKDVALNQGWDVAPANYTTGTTTTTDQTVVASTPVTGYSTDEDVVTTTTYADNTANLATTGRTATETTMTDDTLTVPVYEEELVATKRRQEVGGARIEKSVETEQETLEVPVTEERLKVVRRVVDRDVSASDAAFEDVIVDVPIEVEDVDVATRARVAEEVVIQKEDVQRTEQVTGTVRREHVEVTEAVPGVVEGADTTVRTTNTTTGSTTTSGSTGGGIVDKIGDAIGNAADNVGNTVDNSVDNARNRTR